MLDYSGNYPAHHTLHRLRMKVEHWVWRNTNVLDVSDKFTIPLFSGESENTDNGHGGRSYVSLEPKSVNVECVG